MGKFRRRRNSDEYAGLLCILCSVLLGRMEEDSQHCDGKDDAEGICNSGVVDGSALSGLAVEEAAQALRSQNEVSRRNCAHEGSRHSGDPVVLLLLEEVHGSCPQNDHSQSLVGPAEVAPDNGVVDEAQCIADAQESADTQNRDAELQAVCVAVLIDLEPVEIGRASCRERV